MLVPDDACIDDDMYRSIRELERALIVRVVSVST